MGHIKGKQKEYDVSKDNLKWNFNLDNGRETDIVDHLLSGGIEIKTESAKNWKRYGNIYIEYAQLDGRPSGIETTTSTLWIHALYEDTGELFQYLMIPTDTLRELCYSGKYKQVVSHHKSSTNVTTWGYVIPIKEIIKKLNPYI